MERYCWLQRGQLSFLSETRVQNIYDIRSNDMYERIEVVLRIEYECKYANEDRMVTRVEGID